MSSSVFVEVHSAAELATLRPLPPIVIGDQFSAADVLDLYERDGTQHVIQRSNLALESEKRLSLLMLNEPDLFLSFPLSAILGPTKPNKQSEVQAAAIQIDILSVSQKNEILKQIKAYLETVTQSKSLVYDISIVADELITNAIFNAPYVDPNNTRSGPARNSNLVEIDLAKQPRFFCGKDSERIIIGVRDAYGTLNTDRLISRIQLSYRTNPKDQMSFAEGGAGIGTFMIFESCATFYVGVKKGASTVVCCAFPTGISSRQRTLMPKNLHVLSL